MARNFDPAVSAITELGAKALLAFGAIKALQGGLKALGAESAAGAQTNRAAYAANVNAGWLNRFQAAMKVLGNVDPAATQGALMQAAGNIAEYRLTGQVPDEISLAAQQLHVNFLDKNFSIEKFLTETLPNAMQKEGADGAAAYKLAGLIGFGELAPGLSKGGTAIASEMQRAGSYAAKDTDLKQLELLQQSINRFEEAIKGLTETLIAGNPWIIQFVDALTEIISSITNYYDRWMAIAQLLSGITPGKPPPRTGPPPMGKSFGWLIRLIQWMTGMDPGTRGAEDPEGSIGPEGPAFAIPDNRSFWRRIKDRWNGRVVAPIPENATGSGPVSSNTTANRSLPLEARAFLDTIAGPESHGSYNARWPGKTFSDFSRHPNIHESGPEGPSDAAGRYQMLSSTWRSNLRAMGLPLDTPFTPENQDRVGWNNAVVAYKRQTGRDLLTDLKGGNIDAAMAAMRATRQWDTARSAGYSAALARERGDSGKTRGAEGPEGSIGPNGPALQTYNDSKMSINESYSNPIVPGSTIGNTHNDLDFHGGINVTVPPGSDGLAIGGAVANAIRANVYSTNTGVE
jgi:muramidase (phage lysozyme)